MTQEQVASILDRSSKGEGVVNILREMNLDIYESLEYLKRHHDQLKEAKATYRRSLENQQ